MKKLLTLLIFLAVAAPAAAQTHQLSEADAQVVLDCINNVNPDKGALSPDKADECVDKFNEDGGALMDKAAADFPEIAVLAAARNNALSDLRDIIVKYDGRPMALGLTRVLQERGVLKQMRLGPKPESLFDWVGKNLPSRLMPYKKGIRSWDSLGNVRIQAMKNQTEASWEALVPADRDNSKIDRYKTLYFNAQKKADELLAASQMAAKKKAAAGYGPLVLVLKEDLAVFGDNERIEKLDKMMSDLGEAEAKPVDNSPSAADKKSKDLQDASNRLKTDTAGGKADTFLARTFDKADAAGGAAGASGVGIGGKGAAFTPVPITDAQAAQLGPKMGEVKNGKMTGALADEMRGTKAGDEIIAFLEDTKYAKSGANKLNLKFVKGSAADGTDTALGWYSSGDKVTRINTDVVDKFCASRKITPEQLLKDDAALHDLATYVAPTFVHETTHHRQDAWSTSRGFNFLRWTDSAGNVEKYSPYQMEMEAEAFGMNGSFTAEKAQKGGLAYLRKLDPIDRDDAERYLEDGVDGLRKQYHGQYYTGIDSIKGSAAKQFDDAFSTASRAQFLAKKAQEKGAGLTDAEKTELAEDRQALKTRFKWYVDTLAKSKDDERKLLGWRDSIDPEGKVLSTIKTSLMPEPGGE